MLSERQRAIAASRTTERQRAIAASRTTERQRAIAASRTTERQRAIAASRTTERQRAIAASRTTERQRAIAASRTTERQRAIAASRTTERHRTPRPPLLAPFACPATTASFRTRPAPSHSIHSRCAASSSSSARRPICAAIHSASVGEGARQGLRGRAVGVAVVLLPRDDQPGLLQ